MDNNFSILLSVLIGAVLSFVIFVVMKDKKEKRRTTTSTTCIEGIPGPAKDPKGHLEHLAKSGSMHAWMAKLCKEYGPVSCFQFGPDQPVVSVCGAEAFADVQRVFNRPTVLFENMRGVIGDSVQYANDDEAKFRRSAYVNPAYSHKVLQERVAHDIADACSRLLLRWNAKVSKGESVLTHQESIFFALDSIATASFGKTFSEEELFTINAAYDDCAFEMEEVLAKGPAPKGSERELAFHSARNVLFDVTSKIIKDFPPGMIPNNFLSLIAAAKRKDESPLSLQSITDESLTILIGGFHTSGNLIAWSLYFIARDPSVQDKIWEELKEAGIKGVPTMEDVGQLKYLKQVINETLRCSVLAPWAARVSENPLTVLGHQIPQGTPILLGLGATLEDPSIYPSPHTFDPSRFSPENAKGRHTLSFAPFGFAGRRVCPGKLYAIVEAQMALSAILSTFEICLQDPDVKINRQYGFVTKPDKEIPLVVKKRNA